MKLLFPKNASMVLGGMSYKINNFVWNGKYLMNRTQRNNLIPYLVKANIDLYLHEGNHLSFIDSTRLHCSQKYHKIMTNYNYLHTGKDKIIPIKKTAPLQNIPIIPVPRQAQVQAQVQAPRQLPIATPISNRPNNISTRKIGGRNNVKRIKNTKNTKKNKKL